MNINVFVLILKRSSFIKVYPCTHVPEFNSFISILPTTIGIDRSRPYQAITVAQSHLLLLLQIFLDDVLLDEDGVLTLVHLDHPKALQGADDVLRLDAGHLRDVPYLQIVLLGVLGKEGEEDVRPVRAV